MSFHSSRTTKSPFTVIMSAWLPEFSIPENRTRSAAMYNAIKQHVTIEHYINSAQGQYKGVKEESLVIRAYSAFEVGRIVQIAHEFMQESVLVADNHNKTVHLQYLDGTCAMLGKELVVTQLDSKGINTTWNSEDDYTIVGSSLVEVV